MRRCWIVAPCLAVVLAAAPSHGQTTYAPVAPAFLMPGAPGDANVSGHPALAYDGTNFLLVWTDSHTGTVQAYARRISPDGAMLDDSPIALGRAGSDSRFVPSVAFDGTNFVVVWLGDPASDGHYEVLGVRVARTGSVLDTAPVQLTTGADAEPRRIPIACDGTGCLVVWRRRPLESFSAPPGWVGTQAPSQIRALRLTTAPALLASDGATGFVVKDGHADIDVNKYPHVAFGAGVYLVVWHREESIGTFDRGDIMGALVSPAGTVLAPGVFPVYDSPQSDGMPVASFDGANFLVAWTSSPHDGEVRGPALVQFVSPAGALVGPVIRMAERSWGEAPVRPVFDGTDHLLVTNFLGGAENYRNADVLGRRLSPAGEIVDARPFPIVAASGNQFGPVAAAGGGRLLVVYPNSHTERACGGTIANLGSCVAGQVFAKVASTPVDPPPTPVAPSGEVWAAVSSPTPQPLLAVHAFEDGTALATADMSPQFRFDGVSWGPSDSNMKARDYALWATRPGNVWSAGWCSRSDHTEDGVTYDSNCMSDDVAEGLWGPSSYDVWMVGTNGFVRRYESSAAPWTRPYPAGWRTAGSAGTSLDLHDIWGTAAASIYAVGERGTVTRFDGAAWTALAGVPTRQTLNAVFGFGANDVFAVGDHGVILHFDGQAWSHQNSGTLSHLHGVWGFRPDHVYAVGLDGTILRYDGTSWTTETSGTTGDLFDVAGDPVTGRLWAVGYQGSYWKPVSGVVVSKTVTPPCTTTLAPASLAFTHLGGTGSVTLSTDCVWQAWSDAPWMHVTSEGSGFGSRQVTFTVDPSATPAPRTGTLRLGGHTFTVTQAASSCTYEVAPAALDLSANGRDLAVSVSTQPGCPWVARARSERWVVFQGVSTASGPGTASFGVGTNMDNAGREAMLYVADRPIHLTQHAALAPGCSYYAGTWSTARPPAAGDGVIAVFGTEGCTSIAAGSPSAPWLALVSSGPDPARPGHYLVSYALEANTAASPRTATLTIAGDLYTITQDACSLTTSASSVTIGAAGGAGAIALDGTCAWTAAADATWVTLDAAAGTGRGSLGYTVMPNVGVAPRAATITVGTQTVAIAQKGALAVASIAPAAGLTSGGRSVSIGGTNFVDGAVVTIGGQPATVHGVTATALDVTTGPCPEGVADVRVALPDGAVATLAAAFTCLAPDADPDGDGAGNARELAEGTDPLQAHVQYFAEGASTELFRAEFAFLNTDATRAASAVLELQTGDHRLVEHAISVPPRAQVTLDVADVPGLGPAEFATLVRSSLPLVADRTMTWGAGGNGSHAETSVAAPAVTWYLAEGATHSSFDLFYLLQNPGPTDTEVEVTYLLPAGRPPIVEKYSVAARGRTTVWVDTIAALADTDVSAVVRSLDGVPIIVERAMYKTGHGQHFDAGHDSAGVTVPATAWFLAEGATGPYFDLFVLIANPGETDAEIEALYLLDDGRTMSRRHRVAAHSRFNIWVDLEEWPEGSGEHPLADVAVSTVIRSLNDVPVVVERAMWWPGTWWEWREAHNSPGATATGTTWGVAAGEVGTDARRVDTFLLVANTSPFPGEAVVTLYFQAGAPVTRRYPLRPNSRTNVWVNVDFPEAAGRRFGAVVESVVAPEQPQAAQVVVERAMYWDAGTVKWAAGTNLRASMIK